MQRLFSGLTSAASAYMLIEVPLSPGGLVVMLADAPAVGLLVDASAARLLGPHTLSLGSSCIHLGKNQMYANTSTCVASVAQL